MAIAVGTLVVISNSAPQIAEGGTLYTVLADTAGALTLESLFDGMVIPSSAGVVEANTLTFTPAGTQPNQGRNGSSGLPVTGSVISGQNVIDGAVGAVNLTLLLLNSGHKVLVLTSSLTYVPAPTTGPLSPGTFVRLFAMPLPQGGPLLLTTSDDGTTWTGTAYDGTLKTVTLPSASMGANALITGALIPPPSPFVQGATFTYLPNPGKRWTIVDTFSTPFASIYAIAAISSNGSSDPAGSYGLFVVDLNPAVPVPSGIDTVFGPGAFVVSPPGG